MIRKYISLLRRRTLKGWSILSIMSLLLSSTDYCLRTNPLKSHVHLFCSAKDRKFIQGNLQFIWALIFVSGNMFHHYQTVIKVIWSVLFVLGLYINYFFLVWQIMTDSDGGGKSARVINAYIFPKLANLLNNKTSPKDTTQIHTYPGLECETSSSTRQHQTDCTTKASLELLLKSSTTIKSVMSKVSHWTIFRSI